MGLSWLTSRAKEFSSPTDASSDLGEAGGKFLAGWMDHHRALVLCRAGQERLADFPRLNHYALGKHSDGKYQIKELLPRSD